MEMELLRLKERNDESSYSILHYFTHSSTQSSLVFDMLWKKKMALAQKMQLTVSRRVWWDHSLPPGDTIFGSLVPAIMGSYRCNNGYRPGLPVGYLPLDHAVAVAYDIFRWKQLEFAYKKGLTLSTTCKALWQLWLKLHLFLVYSWWVLLQQQWSNFEISLQIANRWENDWLPRYIELNLPTLASSNLHSIHLLVAW